MMRTCHVRVHTVTLDMTDAIELSELLDYLAQWLAGASEQVRADLSRFALDHHAMPAVRLQLAGFSRLLIFGEGDVGLDIGDDGGDDR